MQAAILYADYLTVDCTIRYRVGMFIAHMGRWTGWTW